jgi:hypothetical protein
MDCWRRRQLWPAHIEIRRLKSSFVRYWLPPPPLSPASVTPLDPNWGSILACGKGGVGSQFGRLEKKPGTLSTLCSAPLKCSNGNRNQSIGVAAAIVTEENSVAVTRAQESIPPGWESIPGILKRFTNKTGSELRFRRRAGWELHECAFSYLMLPFN